MKNLLPISYFIALTILSIVSATLTFFIDGPLFFVFDTSVSVLVLCGVLMFIRNKLLPLWKAVFLFCLIWEMYFIITAKNLELFDIAFWVCVLIPAFYMNAKIGGITSIWPRKSRENNTPVESAYSLIDFRSMQ